MADRPIQDLPLATTISDESLFVIQQTNRAWKLRGRTFLDFLATELDAHGGIRSIEKTSTNLLVDTYTITYADFTISTYNVSNGRGIVSIEKTSTEGLTDTYTITYNDETSTTYDVTNGAKGDKGDNTYTWIMYSTEAPSDDSDMHETMDNWMGMYYGSESDRGNLHYDSYQWFEIKGFKGDKGDDILVADTRTSYATNNSGQNPPSDPNAWTSTIPIVAQSAFLWTRVQTTYSDGVTTVSYSVARQGADGTGSVSSVNGVSALDGDVHLYEVQGTTLIMNSVSE